MNSHRYYLRIQVAIVISATLISLPPIKGTYDLPLTESQAKDFAIAEGILDQVDSHPGDGEVEFALPIQKQSAKVFGFPVNVTESEEFDLFLVDKGNGHTVVVPLGAAQPATVDPLPPAA